jgi:hypothetical protein
MTSPANLLQGFKTLRRLVPKTEEAERCTLCREALPPHHDHLVDPKTHRLLCSCQACALLFSGNASQYKRVPKSVRFLSGCEIADSEWDALMIPIGIAFFVKHGATGRVAAYYPSPAGPVESLLSLDSWAEIESRISDLSSMDSDAEALLVNRAAHESFVIPIDECYRLAGLMRTHWKGLSGGAEVWREIQLFFTEMKARAQGPTHA